MEKKRMIKRNQQPDPITVSQREAARLLGVCEKTLYDMRQRGQVRATRIDPSNPSSKLLYLYSDLIKFATAATSTGE